MVSDFEMISLLVMAFNAQCTSRRHPRYNQLLKSVRYFCLQVADRTCSSYVAEGLLTRQMADAHSHESRTFILPFPQASNHHSYLLWRAHTRIIERLQIDLET